MREVVDDGDAANDIAHFKASLDAFEAGECGTNRIPADALTEGECGGCGRVERVVLAGKLHGQLGPQLIVKPYLPAGLAVAVPQVADLPVGLWLEAVTFDAAEGFADAFVNIVAAIKGD